MCAIWNVFKLKEVKILYVCMWYVCEEVAKREKRDRETNIRKSTWDEIIDTVTIFIIQREIGENEEETQPTFHFHPLIEKK